MRSGLEQRAEELVEIPALELLVTEYVLETVTCSCRARKNATAHLAQLKSTRTLGARHRQKPEVAIPRPRPAVAGGSRLPLPRQPGYRAPHDTAERGLRSGPRWRRTSQGSRTDAAPSSSSGS